jgi:NAD(P) transhydrogenase
MEDIKVDLAVIGAGPAGQKAAIQAAKLGKSVLVIEKESRLGGACLNYGTIPSKTLREAILDLTGFRERSFYGVQKGREKAKVSIHDLLFRLDKVLCQQGKLIREQFASNDIRVIQGAASFRTVNVLEVMGEEGRGTYWIEAQRIIIATGSRPRNPGEIPFDDHCILDSNRLLKLDRIPESMLVLGSGIIGSEYATMMAALGTKVTLIDRTDRPLRLLDSEMGELFADYSVEMGVEFKGGLTIDQIQKNEKERAVVTTKEGKTFEAETLFFALGRVANVESLGLDNIGLELTPRGHLPVNPLFQTAWPNIFAVGDVIGAPALAATSMEQGRLAARNAFAARTHQFPEFFPFGVYTIPEISWIGATEDQLKERGSHYEVGRAYYYEIARGAIAGDTKGLIKILFHQETREILGVHILGTAAAELIHIAQVAMHFRARIDYFIDSIFNYPTFAEGYRIAALNGVNKSLVRT